MGKMKLNFATTYVFTFSFSLIDFGHREKRGGGWGGGGGKEGRKRGRKRGNVLEPTWIHYFVSGVTPSPKLVTTSRE